MKIIRCTTVAQSLCFFEPTTDALKTLGVEQVLVSSPGKTLDDFGKRYALKVIPIAMKRHISLLYDLKSLVGLIRVFRQERPDMVHSMTPKAGLLCMIAAWLTRVPVRVHTFTGLLFPAAVGLRQRILMFTDRITCACATHVIPEGEGVKNDLTVFHITRKPMKVLGHGNVRGIDLEYYNPASSEVIVEADKLRKPGIFTFIFVGRLVGDKGVNELVEAFVALNKELSTTRLVLVGRFEPELDPLKEETIREIELNQSIEAVGQQSDVRPWLAAADAFVLPSYREGFPNVVIEAGAMNLPSIVTDINGSREIIIEGRNGTIIQPKNAGALLRAMRIFATNDISPMAMEARSLIASRYEQSYVSGCLIEFYREIASSHDWIL